MTDLLGSVGDALGGAGRFITGGGTEGPGSLVDKFGRALGAGATAVASFGPIGDIAGGVGALTGKDPVFGYDMKSWERGLTLAALGGVGMFGAAMSTGRGQGFVHSVAGKWRRPQPYGSRDFEVRIPQDNYMVGRENLGGRSRVVVTEKTPSELAALTPEIPDVDKFFATTKAKTKRILSVEPHPVSGYHGLGRAVVDADDVADDVIAQNAGFFEVLGERLMEQPAHAKAYATAREAGDPTSITEYALNAAAHETAKFAAAHDLGYLKGNTLKAAGAAFQRMSAGERLTPAEISILSDAMTSVAQATWWIDHAELALTPLVGVKAINIDDGDAVIDLRYLQFDAMPLERITAKEINNRISQVFQTHPSGMVLPMAEMIKRFTQSELLADLTVTERADQITKWIDWYPQARRDLEKLAGSTGVDTKALITAASILSAGEEWETNVAKAGKLAELIKANGRNITKIQRAATKAGLKVSKQDVVRTALALEMADPLTFFERGVTGKGGKTLDELGRMWEKGATADELVDLRARAQAHVALKQPSFTYGIAESFDDDLENQAHALARLMAGEDGGLSTLSGKEAIHFSENRRSLPVVVDRQAFKVALGFSIVPDTFLSGQKGVFDAIAQAYRIAADDLGEIPQLGRKLLPEELQAITWMQWRENARVAYTGAPKRPRYQTPGWRRETFKAASWADGHGPTYVFNDEILRMLQGTVDRLPFSGVDAVDDLTDWTRFKVSPNDLNVPSKPVKGRTWREVTIRSETDGSMKITTPDIRPEVDGSALRGRWPTRIKVDGETVWAPTAPARVDDVRALFARWHKENTTFAVSDPRRAGVTGAQLHMKPAPDLSQRPGHHMWIAGTETLQGYSGKLAHDRLAAELRRQGINFTIEHAEPHLGFSKPKEWTDPENPDRKLRFWSQDAAEEELGRTLTDKEWRDLPNVDDEEKRIGAVFSFDTPEDMQRAAAYLDTPMEASGPHRASLDYAQRFGAELGIEPPRWVPSNFEANPELGRRMADVYMDAPVVDEAARPLWEQMNREVEAQYRFMTEELGVQVEFVLDDPYPDHGAMIRDVQENNRLKVFDTRAGIGSNTIKGRDLSTIPSGEPLTDADVIPLKSALETRLKTEPYVKLADGIKKVELEGQTYYFTMTGDGKVTSFLHVETNGDVPLVGAIWRAKDGPRGGGQKLYRAAYDDGVDIPNALADSLTDQGRAARQRFVDSLGGEIADDDLFGHPFMTVGQNNMFRAVHDYFGHAAQANSFSRDGEEIAWILHSQMFSPDARKAMTVETRFQNSALNFSAENVAREAQGLPKEFAEQKVFVPPAEFVELPKNLKLATGPGSNGWEIYREQVLERIFYTDSPNSAPAGSVPVLESRWRDDMGRELINLNVAGDAHRSNATQVYLPADYAGFVTPSRTRSLDPGAGGHFLEQRNGKWWMDGQAEVVDPGEGITVAPSGKGDFETAVKLKFKAGGKTKTATADTFLIHMTPEGIPQISYGASGKVTPAEIPGADPARTFEVRRSGTSLVVKAPTDRGRTDGYLASQLEDLLVRMGATGKVRFEGKKAASA
jgi:hypothetical protein